MSRRPRVVVTRPSQGGDTLSERLTELECEVVVSPTIAIGPPRSYEALDRLARYPAGVDWILFMSRHAVRYFAQRQRRFGATAKTHAAAVQIAAVGAATAATARRAGLAVDFESNGRTGADLAGAIVARAPQGSTLAIVQAEDGRDESLELVRRAGLAVRSVPAYRTRPAGVPAQIVREVKDAEVDALAFASPSSAISFAVALGGLRNVPQAVCVGVIGPTTAQACRRAGREPDVVAAESSGRALAEAIVGALRIRAASEA